MSPREARIPPQLLLREVSPEQYLRGFRTVKVGEPDHPDLPDSFRSHYEEGVEPRYRQTQHAALHMAVSFWRNQETARILAKRYPKHGNFIATVEFPWGQGIDYLDPSMETDPEHLTVWGSPEALAAAVVAIVPV